MSLKESFGRWLNKKQVITLLQQASSNPSLQYEGKSILERFLLASLNGDPNAYWKAEQEIAAKFKGDNRFLRQALDLLTRLPRVDFVKVVMDTVVMDTVRRKDFNLYASSSGYTFQSTVTSSRLQLLKRMSSLSDFATLLLNYDSLLSGGQQWGIPWPVAKYLFDNGFLYEGFASPLNSRYLDFYPEGKDKFYCSLFPSDSPFGSLGNFFNQDLTKFEGSWSINPPMLEGLIDKMADRILQACLNEKNQYFFVSMSYWEDASGYLKLVNSPYLVEKQVLRKGSYYYQEPGEGMVPVLSFDSVYLILASKGALEIGKVPTQEFLTRLLDLWSPNSYLYRYLPVNTLPLVIDRVYSKDKSFYLVNDAVKFDAGSKERGMPVLVDRARRNELVYAGPATGYAQIALAKAAFIAGGKTTLFIQSQSPHFSPITKRASRYGAKIILFQNSLDFVKRKAEKYLRSHPEARMVEFGMNDEEVMMEVQKSLLREISISPFIQERPPKAIWLTSGSATLLRILYPIFPDTFFNAIQVGRTLFPDLLEEERTKVYVSGYKFFQPTKFLPPYPSIPSYDAKLWEFTVKYGREGDYIWNVGKE